MNTESLSPNLEFNYFLGHLTLLPVVLLCHKMLSAAKCNGVRLLSDLNLARCKYLYFDLEFELE